MSMHYLYRITDTLNDKVYIGQSNKEKERWRQHKYLARQENPVQYVHRAMKKYGSENFCYEVIAMCRTQEDADIVEEQLIAQYDSYNKEHGYNIAHGGNHVWNAGLPKEQQPMYGKHHTEEIKRQIAKSNTGVAHPKHTDKWKQEASVWLTGRSVSDETKQKISDSQKGKPRWTEEQKQKMSIKRKGIKLSEEHRRKIALAMKKVKQ
jgi:group I intron endonuclease